jgi:ferritin-like protein
MINLPADMNPLDYLARCSRLRGRGLSEALVQDLQEAGNLAVLVDLERCSDAALAHMSDLHRGMTETAQALARQVIEGRLLTRGLVVEPLLWEGDDS